MHIQTKMNWNLSVILFYTFCLKYGVLIKGGSRTYVPKRFMVYLVKSKISKARYDNWMCGGAIVSPLYILTSGACLIDVKHVYAIAGYVKNIRSELIDTDDCTKRRKQRIVKICVPKTSEFGYKNVREWSRADIGLAMVEKPYNFSDVTYRDYCSYIPAPIPINYDPKYTRPLTSAVVYGWGHLNIYRTAADYQDYNQDYLRGASTLIVEKKVCVPIYQPHLHESSIRNFMLCCSGSGILDFDGTPFYVEPDNKNGWRRKNQENFTDYTVYNETRNANFSNETTLWKSDPKVYEGRRQGFCQNDHGSPLVTWIGRQEFVLGVATAFMVDGKYRCHGPYLYTCTLNVTTFLRCVLNAGVMLNVTNGTRRNMCDDMGPKEGYEIHETEIDWNLNERNGRNEINETKNEVKNVFKGNEKNDRNQFKNNGSEKYALRSSNLESNDNGAVNDFPQGSTGNIVSAPIASLKADPFISANPQVDDLPILFVDDPTNLKKEKKKKNLNELLSILSDKELDSVTDDVVIV